MNQENGTRDSSMAIKEMSEPECRAFLTRAHIGRLACALDDQPYVVPVSVVYEEEYIYSFSTIGQKIQWMRKNPKVCVQLDELTAQSRWMSVIATGLYQELREPQFETERSHARKLLDRKSRWWLNALAERDLRSSDALIDPVFFRIRIESLSGLEATEAEPNG
jgi:nitroimidazol reductase NimA-like FMN-containing flavoprotein (pyridoxamine 5'-phosphate oxidase superfamily)